MGFGGGYASSRHYLSCSVIAGEGDDMQRDDWYQQARSGPRRLTPTRSAPSPPAAPWLSASAPARFPTCECRCCSRTLAAGLIGAFVHAVSGGALYRKSSFLLDSLGKQHLPPATSRSPNARTWPRRPAPFDDDGVATKDRKSSSTACCRGYFPNRPRTRPASWHAHHRQRRWQPQPAGQPGQYDLDGLMQCRWTAVRWSPNCWATA